MDDTANTLEPLAVTVKEAARISGKGRTKIYEALREGKLHAVKDGERTLIIFPSLRAYVASLPPATFRKPAAESARRRRVE